MPTRDPRGKIRGELAALIGLAIGIAWAIATPPAQIFWRCVALVVCLVLGVILALWADIPGRVVPLALRLAVAVVWLAVVLAFGVGTVRGAFISATPGHPTGERASATRSSSAGTEKIQTFGAGSPVTNHSAVKGGIHINVGSSPTH
jgi:hypothetical protein